MEDILLRNLHFLKKTLINIRFPDLVNGFNRLRLKTTKNSGNPRKILIETVPKKNEK
jgi:hypothetical protein